MLMGGMSAEREISLVSGRAVLEALEELGYDAFSIDVKSDLPLVLSESKPDVVFIALHGRGGEDGTVQGLLEIMRIPYTGSGVFSSAAAMDKVVTKTILKGHGIPVIDDVVVEREIEISEVTGRVKELLRYPVMVKPAREGSSIGVTRVDNESGLLKALDEVFARDDKALIEKYIDGRLLTVGIIGDEPIVLPVLEIKVKDGFYDFQAKYEPGRSEYEVPARIGDDASEHAKEIALKSFHALQCEGVARIDMMYETAAREIAVLEINTVPGMTQTSLLPKAARAVGLEFTDVVDLILKSARLKVSFQHTV